MTLTENEASHSIANGFPIDQEVRTDVDCTNCSKAFVAVLDFSVDGNHIVECPYCRHEHCRTIKKGVVTGDRWDSRMQRVNVQGQSVWKSDSRPMTTSTAAAFLRESWMKKWDSK